jgi:hypothetical protein
MELAKLLENHRRISTGLVDLSSQNGPRMTTNRLEKPSMRHAYLRRIFALAV